MFKIPSLIIIIICFCLLSVSSPSLTNLLCSSNATGISDMNCNLLTYNYSDANFSNSKYKDKTKLIFMEYNVAENGYGTDQQHGLGYLINQFASNILPLPDVLLVSEIARDCLDYGKYLDGIQMMAQSLKMNAAFTVEYIELDPQAAGTQCTIGNAIFSKYELSDIKQTRFDSQCCTYPHRIGGRSYIAATINFPPLLKYTKNSQIRVYGTHLESGQYTAVTIEDSILVRVNQGLQILNDAQNYYEKGQQIVIGGDLNAPFEDINLFLATLRLQNYEDSHQSIKIIDRQTEQPMGIYDYLFAKSDLQWSSPNICKNACKEASDHFPIWATLEAAEPQSMDFKNKSLVYIEYGLAWLGTNLVRIFYKLGIY